MELISNYLPSSVNGKQGHNYYFYLLYNSVNGKHSKEASMGFDDGKLLFLWALLSEFYFSLQIDLGMSLSDHLLSH